MKSKDFYDTLSPSCVKNLRNLAFASAVLICVAFFVLISYVLQQRSKTAQAFLLPLSSDTFPQPRLRQIKIQQAVPLLATQFGALGSIGARAPNNFSPSTLQIPERNMVTKTVEMLAAAHALPHSTDSVLLIDSGCATSFAMDMTRHFGTTHGQRELVAAFSSFSVVETLLQQLSGHRGVRIIEAASTKLPLANDRFNAAFIFGCVRDQENLWATITEMKRVLVDESQFVIVLPDAADTPSAAGGVAPDSSHTNAVLKHVAGEFKSALLATLDANHFLIVREEELTQYSIRIIIATSPSTPPIV